MEKQADIMSALDRCADLDRRCEGCVYDNAAYCEVELMKDAVALIRELEQKYRAAVEMAAIATEKLAQGVVRCKDCRFWVREFDNVGYCNYAGIHLDHADYGFCSYGERRTDG